LPDTALEGGPGEHAGSGPDRPGRHPRRWSDCLADLAALRDQAALFGPVASHPTAYRVLDRVGTVQLAALRTARADARARVWAAGGGPDLTDAASLIMDADASLLTAHSEKEGAAATYRHGFGFHPLLVILDRPDVSGGEALAAILRLGNAGGNGGCPGSRRT